MINDIMHWMCVGDTNSACKNQTMGADPQKLSVDQTKPGVDPPKPGVDPPNPGVDPPNPAPLATHSLRRWLHSDALKRFGAHHLC